MRRSQKMRQARDNERPIVGMTKEKRLALIGASLNNVVLSSNTGGHATIKRNGIKHTRAIEMFKNAFLNIAAI